MSLCRAGKNGYDSFSFTQLLGEFYCGGNICTAAYTTHNAFT